MARFAWLMPYGMGLLGVALVTVLRFVLHPQLGERVPLTLYFLAVMLAAWSGGMGPSLFTATASVLLAAHYFIPPDNSLMISEPADVLALLVFFVVAVASSLLSQSLRTMRRRAEQHAQESVRLNEELQRTNRYKDEFLAMLAHELRNPLAPIHNALHVLRLKEDDPAAVAQMREMIERQTQAIVRLVDDLLDVSRIKRGKLELRRETVELTTVLGRAVEMAQPLIEAEGHRLEIKLPDQPLWIDADPLRMAQVFVNLLNNAAKYTDRGGRITLSAEREGGQVLVRCCDTGDGIGPELLPHIFERFVQAEQGHGRSRGGLGIGLALVQSLVEAHGGSIEAHSAGLGQGSEFVVCLPLVKRPEAARTPVIASAGAAGCRVLIVDDAVDAASSLAQLLSLEGYTVSVAHDGLTGLAIYQSEAPDIVLLDLEMPGMDGYEVARCIRKRPDAQRVKLIALTGWGHEEDRRGTQEAGFDHHLVKPLNFVALEKLLQSYAVVE